MEYIVLFLLIIPLFIICQISRIIFKKAKKLKCKYVTFIRCWFAKVQFNKNRSAYRANKQISRNIFNAVSLAVFILLLVASTVIPELLGSFIKNHIGLRYAIIICSLYYLDIGCQSVRRLSKECDSLTVTIILVILTFIAILPTLLTFLLVIKTDFDIVITTILFFSFPLYYSTLSMLDIVENPLLRNLFGYVFSILIAVYTALAIGIYNVNTGGITEDLSTYTGIAKMIIKGIVYLSQTSLKDIVMTGEDVLLDRVMQFLIAGYGALVIVHIKKVSSGSMQAKEKPETK